jgi:hypothetical protein
MGVQKPPPSDPSFVWSVLRADDLLVLGFRFFNLAPRDSRLGAPLVRIDAGAPAFVVIDLAPQHIFEEATAEDPPTPVRVPAGHRLARPSRLAFVVPDSVESVPFTLDALLAWDGWSASVVPVMAGPVDGGEAPPIREPFSTETSLELPYRLVLSPDQGARWVHSTTIEDEHGYDELWHSRMTASGLGDALARAVWSPDWPEPPAYAGVSYPIEPMSADVRHQIVGLTSDWTGLIYSDLGGASIDPVALPIENLIVSALGGWLRVHASFFDPPPDGYDLVDWRHVATEGRDHYTKIVRAGTLYPFGLRAHLITITERKLVDTAAGPAAALLQRTFIIVRQPFRDYSGEPYFAQGREMPLRTIQVTTLTTPNLMDPPPPLPDIPKVNKSCKVVLPDGVPVPFHIKATDVAGQSVEFSVGMFWISDRDKKYLPGAEVRADLATAYAEEAFSRADLGGQRVTFAPQPEKPAAGLKSVGDTSLHASALRHEATWVAADEFLPQLRNSDVRIPAVDQLAGPSAPATTIELADAYLSHGLDDAINNASGLFARIAGGSSLPVSLPPKVAGGVINPDLGVTGLSAHLGPVAGTLSKLASGTFDPADFFGAGSSTKLFGAVGLSDLIDGGFKLGQMPQMVTRTEPPAGPPTEIVTTLAYEPVVRDRSDLGFQKDPGSSLSITTVVEQHLDGKEPKATTDASLTNFTFLLPPGAEAVIKVHFAKLSFRGESGKKGDFSVELVAGDDAVEFAGVLSFLNELKKFIPDSGFSDPPALEVTENGVRTGYSLGLPPIPLGVFQLSDVRLGAELELPFTAEKPRLRFNFCEREHPCLLTVSMLGGGAFLAIGVGLDGIELIEAAIDFGGSFSIDLGVASTSSTTARRSSRSWTGSFGSTAPCPFWAWSR